MNYLVMEIRTGYAVALDEEGRFLRTPNMGYHVGQHISDIIAEEIQEEQKPEQTASAKKLAQHRKSIRILAAAACLCILILGTRQFLFVPYGTIRMQINPDVMLSMNRFSYVVGIKGMNQDGELLIEDYSYLGKDAVAVSEELTDRAAQMGYLTEGGDVTLTVTGEKETWKEATQEKVVTELEHHCQGSVHVNASEAHDGKDDSTDKHKKENHNRHRE